MSEVSTSGSALEESLDDHVHDARIPTYALVIDDSHTGRRIVDALLSVFGFTVIEAQNPYEASAAIEKYTFSLITIDRNLGDYDGVDLVRKLRQNPKCGDDPRILAVTGNVGKAHSQAFFDAGADAFLNKPFNVNELSEMLKALGFSVHS